VHHLLSRLYSPANEAPDHGWTIQTVPREKRHEFPHLSGVLWPLIPTDPLLQDVTDVTKGGSVGLFSDVEPLLVPFTKRGIPGIVEVL
jgi:hypothetical protein